MTDRLPASPFDAYTPPQIAALIEAGGVRKAAMPTLQLATLGLLGGGFIAFGAMLYTAVVTGSTLGWGPTRLIGGGAFSLGLVLVVVGGAELFTGNNLIAMAWASRKIDTASLLRNWTIVYAANFVGAVGAAMLMWLADGLSVGGAEVRATAIEIARAKLALEPLAAFGRGVLCNALVCLAAWLCMAAHDVASKAVAILLPVTAFVALGFEHSVANMYLMPVAWLHGATDVTLAGLLRNLVPVTLGNLVGGTLLVALVYWLCYLRSND